jgi:hypothetical protein
MKTHQLIACCFLSALLASAVTAMLGQGTVPVTDPLDAAIDRALMAPTDEKVQPSDTPPSWKDELDAVYAGMAKRLDTDLDFSRKVDDVLDAWQRKAIGSAFDLLGAFSDFPEPRAYAFDQHIFVIGSVGQAFVVDHTGCAKRVFVMESGDIEPRDVSFRTGVVRPGRDQQLNAALEVAAEEKRRQLEESDSTEK